MDGFMQSTALINMSGITKRFGEKTVLNNLAIEVHPGEFVAVMGKSGSGKSTLINIIGLLEHDFLGEYQLLGEDVHTFGEGKCTRFRNRNLGFIFQAYHLLNHCTVRENILLPASYSKKKVEKDYYEELVTSLEIQDLLGKEAALLSGGEKQRVCIARALINRPLLVIADEPTGNLDGENTERVYRMLQERNQKGTTIVMVTHDRALASRAGRVLVLENGRLAEVAE